MTRLHQRLRQFGLNDNETKVYSSVFRLGDCSIGAIERETSLHRQLIYNAAASLEAKGLLSVQRLGGRRRFSAAPAATFLEQYEAGRQNVLDLVRNLEMEKKSSRFSGEAKLYRGSAEVRQYYIHSAQAQPLRSRVHILGIESTRFFQIFAGEEDAFRRFEEIRVARKITWDLMLSSSKEKELALNRARPLVSCHLLKSKISAPFDIVVWRDHVGLLVYGDEITLLDLPGDPIARGFRKYLTVLKEGSDVMHSVEKSLSGLRVG